MTLDWLTGGWTAIYVLCNGLSVAIDLEFTPEATMAQCERVVESRINGRTICDAYCIRAGEMK